MQGFLHADKPSFLVPTFLGFCRSSALSKLATFLLISVAVLTYPTAWSRVFVMVSHYPLRVGVVLFLFIVPYFCDVVSNDELPSNLLAQEGILLETDLDDDKDTEAIPSGGIVIEAHTSLSSVYAVGTSASLSYISQTSLAVSGSRPPPLSL